MRSSGISRNSHMWHFQFFIWLKSSLGEIQFAENPTWIGPVVPRLVSNWRILRTKENNRNLFLFLAISHNQCCLLPTDPARSQVHVIKSLYYYWCLNVCVDVCFGCILSTGYGYYHYGQNRVRLFTERWIMLSNAK